MKRKGTVLIGGVANEFDVGHEDGRVGVHEGAGVARVVVEEQHVDQHRLARAIARVCNGSV